MARNELISPFFASFYPPLRDNGKGCPCSGTPAFAYFFANRVKEAADSLLFNFEDYQPQLFSTKRAADWTIKASSGSITRFTVNVQYSNVENEFANSLCTLTTKQDGPTDSLTLSRSKIAEATTDSD